MNRPMILALVLATSGAAIAAGLGCGGGGGESQMMTLGTPSPEVTPPGSGEQAPTPDGQTNAPPTGQILDIVRVEFAESARDPFVRPRSADSAMSTVETQGSIDACSDPAEHPLGQVPPERLRLLALITGTAVPRAMFVVQGDPTGIVVGEGARIGPSCHWVIDQIRDNEVLIQTRGMGEEIVQVEHTFYLSTELVDADVDW